MYHCGDTGHTQFGYEDRKGDVVGGCYKTITDPNAPQLSLDWMNCRASLKNPDETWHKRLRRNDQIWRHTEQQASEAAESLVHRIATVVKQAIKSEKAKNLPTYGVEFKAATLLIEEYMQARVDFG